MKFLARLLVFFGVAFFIFGIYLLWERTNPQRLSFSTSFTESLPTSTNQNTPQRIILSDEGIDLPVIPATIQDGKWEATTQGVSYLQNSPVPGEQGNSILYGHNYPNLLGNLTKAKPGQKIEIKFADGLSKIFTIEYTSVVFPSETYVLKPSDDRRITLYTCTGFLDRKRFVVTAILKDN